MLTRAAAAAAAAKAASEAAEAEAPAAAEGEPEAAEAAEAAEGEPEVAPAAEGEAAGDAAAAEAPMGQGMIRAQLTRTATLILSGTKTLSNLIDRTEYSRAKVIAAIDLLHEAAQELHIPLNGAGRILALHHEGVFAGPLPASINAARRIAGHLSGVLPRAAYLPISQCWLNVTILANFFDVEAYDHLTVCVEMLGLADESPQSQRWSDRMAISPVSSAVARRRLVDADVLAVDVHLALLRVLTYWHPDGVWRLDPSVGLSSAEGHLHVATDLVNEALVAMRRIRNHLELQAFELLIVARNQ